MITVVGEALVDVVTTPDGEQRSHPGGSPANVALTLARLQTPVTLLTDVGRDEPGAQVLRHLTGNGVQVDETAVGDGPTSVAEARLDAEGIATYEFRLRWQLDSHAAVPADSVCLHTGSLGAVLLPGADTVRALADAARAHATISYDPNCRPAIQTDVEQARRDVEDWVGRSDLVKVSDEDLAWLYPGADPPEVAQRWLDRGPALVVVTQGGDGVHAATAAGTVDVAAVPVQVVDTVGAGDSYTGALLDGLSRNDLLGAQRRTALQRVDAALLRRLLEDAALVAAITCSRAGANPPTRAELHAARQNGAVDSPTPG
ncbi:MAG: carbohydrate kinase [Actinomycetota bacterium]|nr:carbohydrate kinase [Actinomycetota bacterium]